MECKLKAFAKACDCLPWYIPRMPHDENKPQICGRAGNQCYSNQLKIYRAETADCTHCKDDCTMVHFFTTLAREEFSTDRTDEDIPYNNVTQEGLLSKYLIDPQRIFSDKMGRNLTKFTYGLVSDEEFAHERFSRDITVLNFFFDTQIITEIQQELKTTVFDMISAVGGTLGLFTGISVITMAEVVWYGMWYGMGIGGTYIRGAKTYLVQRFWMGTESIKM